MAKLKVEISGEKKPKQESIAAVPDGTVFKYSDGTIGLKLDEQNKSASLNNEEGEIECVLVVNLTDHVEILGRLVGIIIEKKKS